MSQEHQSMSQKDNQALSIKSFKSQKSKPIKQRIVRVKALSQKKQSEKELSNISEKLEIARSKENQTGKIYSDCSQRYTNVMLVLNTCIQNSLHQELLQIKKDRQSAKAALTIAENDYYAAKALVKKLQEIYQKQSQIHVKHSEGSK